MISKVMDIIERSKFIFYF